MISGAVAIPVFINESKSESPRLRSYIDNKRGYFLMKRITDLFVSIVVIICILSWLSLIIGMLILLDSKGPVFFVQKRVGKSGKAFFIFKFRTMIVNKEADRKRATMYDWRITKIGKVLRTYNLDELPQFFNVFIGDMSITGPRPYMHSDCRAFAQIIPGYKFRTFVKPGITGLAQSKGLHGPATNKCLFEKRFQCDAFYIRNASMKLDSSIIYSTIVQHMKLLLRLL